MNLCYERPKLTYFVNMPVNDVIIASIYTYILNYTHLLNSEYYYTSFCNNQSWEQDLNGQDQDQDICFKTKTRPRHSF